MHLQCRTRPGTKSTGMSGSSPITGELSSSSVQGGSSCWRLLYW